MDDLLTDVLEQFAPCGVLGSGVFVVGEEEYANDADGVAIVVEFDEVAVTVDEKWDVRKVGHEREKSVVVVFSDQSQISW